MLRLNPQSISDLVKEEKLSRNDLRVNIDILVSLDFWSISNSELNMIDVFKGIVPKSLSDHLFRIVTTETRVYKILTILYNMLFARFKQDVWIPSRERLHIYVRECMGLTATQRRMICHKDFTKERSYEFTSALENVQLIDYKEIMRDLIYFGKDDFMYIDSIT